VIRTKFCALMVAAACAALSAPLRADPGEPAGAQSCDTTISNARHVLEDADHPLADAVRGRVYDALISCESSLGDESGAYRDALRATALPVIPDFAWMMRLFHETGEKKFDAALATIELAAAKQPSLMTSIKPNMMWWLHTQLRDGPDKMADIRLLEVLSTAYTAPDPFLSPDGFRILYARALHASGKTKDAAAMVNAVRSLSDLATLYLDPDLRPLRAGTLDLRAEAERQLTEDQARLAAHRDWLSGFIAVANDLNRLGRYREALALLESVRPDLSRPNAFKDKDDEANWWAEMIARTYLLLGDYDRLAQSYRAAIAENEMGEPNVSQLLNFAVEQIRFGHPDQALATLALATDEHKRSPYGEMVLRSARGCASFQLGKAEDAARDRDYVLAHIKDNRAGATDLLLCLGDLDRAAALIIDRLEDKDQRTDMLRQLAEYRLNAPALPEPPEIARLPAIKARPDIKAAIAKAGGLPSFPFRRDEL